MVDAGMAPRPDDQVDQAVGIVGLHRLVDGRRTVAVFLVPLTDDQHGRHGHGLATHPLVDGHVGPGLVIGRMFQDQLVERVLVHAVLAGVVTHRAVVQVHRIVVDIAIDRSAAFALGGGLLDDIVHLTDAEGAVVEGVVTDPGVDHRRLRRHGLERRVRIDLGHQGGEAQIGRADHADLAVRFRRVLHQPVDGVVGVGRLVDLGSVAAGADDRPRHDEVTFGFIHAANILVDADIAVIDELGVHGRQDLGDLVALVAGGGVLGIIGRARQQDRAVPGALLEDDDGVELHAVAHRDHDFAFDIVGGVRIDRLVRGDDIGRHGGNRSGGRLSGGVAGGQQQGQHGDGERLADHGGPHIGKKMCGEPITAAAQEQ